MKNKQNTKNTLPVPGGIINRAGAGSAPGSVAYINMATGNTIEVYQARLVKMGLHYGLVAIVGNTALGSVKIDLKSLKHARITGVGQKLLVGDLRYLAAGPLARLAWPVDPASRPAKPKRMAGFISRVHPSGRFGEITGVMKGKSWFVHHTAFRNPSSFQFGARVTFHPGKDATNRTVALDVA